MGEKEQFCPQDPAGGIALIAKGQTRIQRVLPQWQLEEAGVLAE
jgi:hypothetical protein